MPDIFNTTPAANQGAGLASQNTSGGASKLYQKTLEVYEQTSDFFQQFEGGRDALIRTNTDVSKGAGQTVYIRSLAGFYGEPKEGDSQFEAKGDYEDFVMQDYPLSVDYIRWATRMTERSEEFMGLRGELKAGLPREAGKWLGRIKSERMFMTLKDKCSAENQIVAEGKVVDATAGTSTLLTGDHLDYDEIVAGATRLKTLGGEPAVVKTEGKNTVRGYAVIATTDSLFSLESDTNFTDALRHAGGRGSGNLLFSGGYSDIRGNLVIEAPSVDHDGAGPIGHPLAPKALAGKTVSMSAGAQDGSKVLQGGGNATNADKTGVLYFKWFDNYQYQYSVNDQKAADTGVKYALAINPPTGTDANKWCFFSYTGGAGGADAGNNGNQITIKAVCAASGGSNHLGGVDPTAAPWAGNMTTSIQAGATILPATEDGVPYADTLFLAKGAAVRGYGKHRNKRGTDTHEDGFVTDLYIRSVFGQAVRQDAAGRKPGVVRLRHAINYAGLHLPNVSS